MKAHQACFHSQLRVCDLLRTLPEWPRLLQLKDAFGKTMVGVAHTHAAPEFVQALHALLAQPTSAAHPATDVSAPS